MNQRKKRENISDAEKKNALFEFSKFVLDIAKLTFVGVILGSVMEMDFAKGSLLLYGSLVAIVLMAIGGYAYDLAIKSFSNEFRNPILYFSIYLACSGSNFHFVGKNME